MIIYSENKHVRAEDVSEVFRKSGIKRPFDDLNRIQRMIDHSDVMITAWDDGKMVGVARAITDYSYCCYLSDLAIDKEYQKQGIGKELVNRLQDIVGDECSIILISAPTATDYYPRIGFSKNDRAYSIARKR